MSSKLDRRFESVARALAGGADAIAACAVAGQDLARDGVDLGAALNGLAHTATTVTGAEPDYASVRALSVAWSEETLAFLHDVSCESPLSGVASRAHLRARLAEVHRGARLAGLRARATHALVVLEVPAVGELEHLDRSLLMARVGELCRHMFDGDQTIAMVRADRLVILAERGDDLGVAVARLRVALRNLSALADTRVWIERLAPSDDLVAEQIGELSR